MNIMTSYQTIDVFDLLEEELITYQSGFILEIPISFKDDLSKPHCEESYSIVYPVWKLLYFLDIYKELNVLNWSERHKLACLIIEEELTTKQMIDAAIIELKSKLHKYEETTI